MMSYVYLNNWENDDISLTYTAKAVNRGAIGALSSGPYSV